ncbi:MAG: hypothetical protein ABI705_13500 [Aestuariivirga sp.]
MASNRPAIMPSCCAMRSGKVAGIDPLIIGAWTSRMEATAFTEAACSSHTFFRASVKGSSFFSAFEPFLMEAVPIIMPGPQPSIMSRPIISP